MIVPVAEPMASPFGSRVALQLNVMIAEFESVAELVSADMGEPLDDD